MRGGWVGFPPLTVWSSRATRSVEVKGLAPAQVEGHHLGCRQGQVYPSPPHTDGHPPRRAASADPTMPLPTITTSYRPLALLLLLLLLLKEQDASSPTAGGPAAARTTRGVLNIMRVERAFASRLVTPLARRTGCAGAGAEGRPREGGKQEARKRVSLFLSGSGAKKIQTIL